MSENRRDGRENARRAQSRSETVCSENGVRFCALCDAVGVKTPAEKYRNVALEYCTFHYWLIRGGSGSGYSYTLEDYADASEKLAFKTSLPSPTDCYKMRRVQSDAAKSLQDAAPSVRSGGS